MKKLILASLVFCFALAANGQMETDSIWRIENYDWEETPTPETRPFITALDEAIIHYTHLLELRYEGEDATMFELIHRRIWVGNENVIQSYNKLYLPLTNSADAQIIKARVLLPNGTVLHLDADDVQEGKDEDDNVYQYFALDGVQKGSIVEYLFLTKEQPNYLGTRYTLQRDAPIFDLKFELITPFNLQFRLKSYNALNQAKTDTVLKYQNRYFIHQDTLVKFKEEPQSYERAYLGYVIFALDRNLFSDKRDISSFGYTAATIYSNVNVEIDKKMAKVYKQILAESGMNEERDETLKLARLENYLKENYFVSELGSDAMYDLASILQNHTMNEFGALRLYHTLFKFAGFPNQLVFTSEKSTTPFDPDFENNLMLREELLYFPNQNVFMSPTNITSRLGYFEDELHNTKALFIEEVNLNGGIVGIDKVDKIPPQKANDNRSILEINWKLDPDGEAGKVDVAHTMWGLQTSYVQTFSKYVPEEEMDKFKKSLLGVYYSEVEMKDVVVENLEGVNFPIKPLIVKGTFNDEVYTEPGSTSTIVKVGLIIGPQSELYLTDSVRNLPVHHGFPKRYLRKITMEVPDGYILKNAESLVMNVTSDGEKPLMGFTSNFTYQKNVLEITIDEWYEVGDYPATMFETYRQVMNAAADFNKKYVVLEEAKPQ